MRNLPSSMVLGAGGAPQFLRTNKFAIKLSKGSGSRSRTKHIGVRWHALRVWAANGELSLQYIPTGEQQADLLTEGLGIVKFQELRGLLLSD